MTRARLAAALLLAAGCAYYNGLYNANRLANEAVRAEREGRTGEARSLWSQAAVKAESVVSRHPRSKWRDDALLLQGRAFDRMGLCTQAIAPLALAADSSPDAHLRAEAGLLLGSCRLQLAQPDSALQAVTPVLRDGTASQRSTAQLIRGRALLQLGRDDEAVAELSATAAREAVFPRAIALARLGRLDEAVGVLAEVLADPYDEEGWLPVLDTVGVRDPGRASPLVDRLVERPDLRVGSRIRLWLADGQRWMAATDTGRAAVRFEAVRAEAPDSAEGRTARAHLAVVAARRATGWSEVPGLLDSLQAAVRQGGAAVRVGGGYVSVLTRARNALGPDGSALGLFLAAEDVRDSLVNPVLAGSLLEQVESRFPGSAVAPKALLALAMLHPEAGDSLVGLMRTRYPESPYTLVLQGEGSAAFEAVEDSLARAAAALGRVPRGRGR